MFRPRNYIFGAVSIQAPAAASLFRLWFQSELMPTGTSQFRRACFDRHRFSRSSTTVKSLFLKDQHDTNSPYFLKIIADSHPIFPSHGTPCEFETKDKRDPPSGPI